MQELVEIQFDSIEENAELAEFIKNIVDTCFKEERLTQLNFYLSITLTTPEEIHKLNKEYRKVDKETDVLSFPMFDKAELDEIVEKQKKNVVVEPIGDIIISIERVKEQAKEYGHSFERELAYMIVHGFYHVMGYDHIEEKEKQEMRPKEEKILAIVKQTR